MKQGVLNGNLYGLNFNTQVNTTIYVATTGSDTTGDGTSGKPYATPNKALSILPKFIDHRYIIDIAAGSYTDNLTAYIVTGKQIGRAHV